MKILIPIMIFAIFFSLVNYVMALEETKITISGNTKPEYGKIHSYTITVEGKLYNNGISSLTIYEQGDKSKSGVTVQLTLYEGKNSFPLKLFEEDFGYGMVYQPYELGTTYVIEVINLSHSGTFQFTPQPKPDHNPEIPEDVKASLQKRSITIVNWFQGKTGWITNLKICTGTQALTNPTIIVESDIETVQITLPKAIKSESCARQEFTVKAKDPTTIQARFYGEVAEQAVVERNIPEWIKNNAKEWADSQISDNDFIPGIRLLISSGIIKI